MFQDLVIDGILHILQDIKQGLNFGVGTSFLFCDNQSFSVSFNMQNAFFITCMQFKNERLIFPVKRMQMAECCVGSEMKAFEELKFSL